MKDMYQCSKEDFSTIFKTIDGLYINIKDVTEISTSGFGDESDTMSVLSGEKPESSVENPTHVWVRINGVVKIISLDSRFNCESLCINYGRYGIDNLAVAERRLIELWNTYQTIEPDVYTYDGYDYT
jgi:hypothetical protein